jgi:hypothetical protein
MEEKLARIERGETFDALRKAGKIELPPATTGEINGKSRMCGKYPYIAKGLKDLRGSETLPQATITRKGISMSVPVITDAKAEREFAARYGYTRQ